MRNINQLLEEIIPPTDYQNRNGFSNEHIVLSLTEKEKEEVEKNLIEMLERTDDDLIGEALMFMKSTGSLNALRKKLDLAKTPASKIIWASFINKIKDGDEEMKLIALNEMDEVSEKYSRISTFHYLSRFEDQRINEKIRGFINDSSYLIAYNARTALGIETAEIVKREQIKKGIRTKR